MNSADAKNDPRALRLAAIFTRSAAAFALAMGLLVLCGWMLDVELLKSLLHSGRIAMNPATAVAFVLSGVALLCLHPIDAPATRQRIGYIAAAITVAIGLLRLVGLRPELNLHVDQWLFASRLGTNVMAPNTAAAFVLTGTALLLLNARTAAARFVAQGFALLALGIALLSLTGYFFRSVSLYQVSQFIPMALNTTLAFAALALGILNARPQREPVATIIGGTAGGMVARRLLPVAIVAPLLLGWLRLKGERLDWYDTTFGVALLAVVTIIVFVAVVWWTARLLRRLDIERAATQEQLRASEERHRIVVQQAADGITLVDGETLRILEVNQAFARLLGYGHDELIGRPISELIVDTAEGVAARAQQTLGTEGPAVVQRQYRRKDGSVVETEKSATVLTLAGRRVLCTVIHDITERKRAQALLEEKNRQLQQAIESEQIAHAKLKETQSQLVQTEKLAGLGQMVAGVAHEINNPLSFVSNNVAVLERDAKALVELLRLYAGADPLIAERQAELSAQIKDLAERVDLAYTLENLKELMSRSREGLRRIQQIVKDLRDFARLDQGDQHEVDLNAGIESTVNIILGRAKKKRVQIIKELAPLPTITCHAAKLNQVVMNLLANAIDASNEGGKVTVRTGAENGSIQVAVADTGSGIDPAVRARIFDPFFTTKPLGEGTGLGLSISYGIVQEHGGRIDVDSTLGKGSTFTIVLPLRGTSNSHRGTEGTEKRTA
jgi:PAS domain S-box-containing protein